VSPFLIENPAEVSGACLTRVDIGVGLGPELSGWDSLCEEERSYALSRKPLRHREFVAGRAALRSALWAAGWEGEGPLLPRPSGAPDLPKGFTASVTHKAGVALALARPFVDGKTVGLDSEVLGDRERTGIAGKVLRPSERHRWEAAGSTWAGLLELFCVKEAIYKALYPHVPRYIGFEEAEIEEDGEIRLHLKDQEGPFEMKSWLRWEGERLLAFVEARRN
jgi:enterobactin synthetase component D